MCNANPVHQKVPYQTLVTPPSTSTTVFAKVRNLPAYAQNYLHEATESRKTHDMHIHIYRERDECMPESVYHKYTYIQVLNTNEVEADLMQTMLLLFFYEGN